MRGGFSRRVALRAVAGLASMSLVGCAAPREPWSASDRAAQQRAAVALQALSLQGHLAVWSEREAYSGQVEWTYDAAGEQVRFVAPLGVAIWDLEVPHDGPASLRRGERSPRVAATADGLLASVVGVPVPFRTVSEWLRGLPGEGVEPRDDGSGRLGALRYRDADGRWWEVDFDRYQRIEGLWLPGRIRASEASNSARANDDPWQLRWRLGSAGRPARESPSTAPPRLGIPGA